MLWNPHLSVGAPGLDLSASPTDADQTLHNWTLLSVGVCSVLTQAPPHCQPMHLHHCWAIQSCTLPNFTYLFFLTWVIFCKALNILKKSLFLVKVRSGYETCNSRTTMYFITQSCISLYLKACSTYPKYLGINIKNKTCQAYKNRCTLSNRSE